MRVMVTGANGFIGRALVSRLLALDELRGKRIEAVLLVDQQFDELPDDPRLRLHPGSICDAALLRRALADGIDVVFHLASVPGGAAEADYEEGYRVNLLASLELLEQLRHASSPAVLVYASSVAVYGENLPRRMDESCVTKPGLSYASHKLMVEAAVQDLSRRGLVDGRVLRLPGIVARPREPNGLRSAFMSDLLHACLAGEVYECPVSAEATAWWMSVQCGVDNLLHAARLQAPGPARVWQPPVLHLSVAQVLDALAACLGPASVAGVRFAPDPALEALFGRYPPLQTPGARRLGFRHDGSAAALLRNALHLVPHRRTVQRLGDMLHES